MEFLELLKIIFLGIVEGITEWLPISSTGHLIIANEFIKPGFSDEFMKLFDVVIQLGAIIAVVVIYIKKLWPFSSKKENHYIKPNVWMLWFKVLVACIPSAIFGLLFNDLIDEALGNPWVVVVTLILYGIIFIIIERLKKGKAYKIETVDDITFPIALAIGAFQVLAMIPGTSRSGATIIGAMLIGVSRVAAAEFTFFLAIPTMFGASLLKILKADFAMSGTEITALITGMVVAFVVSILAIKFLVGYIKKHSFEAFGWYRIILGVILIFLLAFVI